MADDPKPKMPYYKVPTTDEEWRKFMEGAEVFIIDPATSRRSPSPYKPPDHQHVISIDDAHRDDVAVRDGDTERAQHESFIQKTKYWIGKIGRFCHYSVLMFAGRCLYGEWPTFKNGNCYLCSPRRIRFSWFGVFFLVLALGGFINTVASVFPGFDRSLHNTAEQSGRFITTVWSTVVQWTSNSKKHLTALAKPSLCHCDSLEVDFSISETDEDGLAWDVVISEPDPYGILTIIHTDGTTQNEGIRQRYDTTSFRAPFFQRSGITLRTGDTVTVKLLHQTSFGRDRLIGEATTSVKIMGYGQPMVRARSTNGLFSMDMHGVGCRAERP